MSDPKKANFLKYAIRHGRTLGRTLYLRTGGDNWKNDTPIGMVDTPELGAAIVEAVNAHYGHQGFGRDSEGRLLVVRHQDVFFAWSWAIEAMAHPAFADAVAPESRPRLSEAMNRLYQAMAVREPDDLDTFVDDQMADPRFRAAYDELTRKNER